MYMGRESASKREDDSPAVAEKYSSLYTETFPAMRVHTVGTFARPQYGRGRGGCMGRSVVLFLLLILVLLALGPIGCGGGGTVGPAAAVTITPSPVSMDLGQVAQVTASVTDANGNAVSTETITYTSSAPNIASISPSGLVCAGSWDSTFIHCNPGHVGTAAITATASPSGVASGAVTIYVHYRADSIVVGESFPVAVPLSCGVPVAPPAGCISAGATVPNNTERFTAMACSNDPVVCAPNAPPCALDPNTLGPLTFAAANTSIATVAADVTNPNFVAVVTATIPGQTQITASLSNTTSLPASFVSCGPQSITIHVASQPTTTTMSLAKAATGALAAEVVDANSNVLPISGLTWSSSIPAVATVSGSGLITGVAPGTTNIVTACAPPTCNAGTQQAIFSNVVQATVTGSYNATTLYVTSSDAGTTTIIPIAISPTSNSAGTAIALPGGFLPPNSFVFAPNGLKAYLGSDSGLIVFDPVAGTTTAVAGAPGKVLAVSNDGTQVVVADTTGATHVYQYNPSSGSVTTLNIAGASGADFTPGTSRTYIVASGGLGDRVYEFGNLISTNLPASGPPTGVALLANGSFAYVADPATDVFSTCTNGQVGNLGIATTLIKAAAKPIASPNNLNLQMIALTGNQITQIDVAPGAPPAPCPGIPTNTSQAYSFPGVAAFTPVQMLVTPDSSHAIVTASDVNQLLVYNIGTTAASGSATTIPLANGATGAYTAAVTVDSTIVWVGAAGVNQVQAYNLTTNAIATALSVPFAPKLVAMRYQ